MSYKHTNAKNINKQYDLDKSNLIYNDKTQIFYTTTPDSKKIIGKAKITDLPCSDVRLNAKRTKNGGIMLL